jgi:hypothetical protein
MNLCRAEPQARQLVGTRARLAEAVPVGVAVVVDWRVEPLTHVVEIAP